MATAISSLIKDKMVWHAHDGIPQGIVARCTVFGSYQTRKYFEPLGADDMCMPVVPTLTVNQVKAGSSYNSRCPRDRYSLQMHLGYDVETTIYVMMGV